jgi:hypothetical protein
MNDSLTLLATHLSRAILPVIIVVGIVGNAINIAVLTRSALYNHACSRYFLALSTNYLFYSVVVVLNNLLVNGYQLDVSKASVLSCKLVTYVNTVCIAISPYFIVLASIDRYCASSRNAQRRKFSNVRVTIWALIFLVALFALYFINTLVLVDLREDDYLGCAIRGDTIYKQAYSIIEVILFAVIAPCLMGFFGGMTIYNTKRVRFISARVTSHRRTENQLIRMLLLQVGTHIILNLPTCILYLIGVLPNSLKFTPEFGPITKICQLFFYSSADTDVILYFLSSGIYRKECIRLMYKIARIHGDTRVHPSTSPNTVIPMNTLAHRQAVVHNSTRHDRSIVGH